jgi:histidinol-phosphatase (PHP family)
MLYLTNYHCHSHFSDGKGTPEDIVKKAIELKMPSVGISEHGPLPYETSWNIKTSKIEVYVNEISELKKKYAEEIEVYCGMEVDYISRFNEQIMKMSQLSKLDYFIGSIHFLGFLKNGEAWNTDGTTEMFDQGMKEIFEYNGKAVVESYYGDTIKMLFELKPTIIGHIDKIKMHNEGNRYFDEESDYYRKIVSDTLDAVRSTDTLVELNTRGLYRHKYKISYPSVNILKEMKQREIRIILSSDGHNTDELMKCFPEGIELLKQAGYKSRWILSKGKWVEVGLD